MNIQIIRRSTWAFLLACIASWAYFHVGISTKEFKVPSFKHLHISGPFRLVLIPAGEKVLLKTDSRLIDQIRFIAANDTLKVFPISLIRRERVLNLRVPVSRLRSLNLAGPVEAICSFPLRGDSLRVNLSGAAEIKLNSHTQFLEINSSQASNMFLSGSTQGFLAQIQGNGELIAYQLETENTELRIKSSPYVSKGICRIWVRDSLRVDLTGSRQVLYRGKPKLIMTETTPPAQVLPFE